MRTSEYLAESKTKKYRYIKKVYLPNNHYPESDIARIRKDMRIDIFREGKVYISIWPRTNGTWWVLSWWDQEKTPAEPGIIDTLKSRDFETDLDLIDKMIERTEFACWVDLSKIREELYAIHIAKMMVN